MKKEKQLKARSLPKKDEPKKKGRKRKTDEERVEERKRLRELVMAEDEGEVVPISTLKRGVINWKAFDKIQPIIHKSCPCPDCKTVDAPRSVDKVKKMVWFICPKCGNKSGFNYMTTK